MHQRINPSTDTTRMLWAHSAGHCEICGTSLFLGSAANTVGNYSNQAHIIAYSEGGPRGNSPSRDDANINSVENLMMLCGKCHTEIDANPDLFTDNMLRHIKMVKEYAIEGLASQRTIKEVEVIRCCVPIAGNDVEITTNEIFESLLADNKMFSGVRPWDFGKGIESGDSFERASERLEMNADRYHLTEINNEVPYAVFAFGPQPILIKLGTILGDKHQSSIYQRQRGSSNWIWKQDSPKANFFLTKENLCEAETATEALLIVQASGIVSYESLGLEPVLAELPRFLITADSPNVYVADNHQTQSRFREITLAAISDIHSSCPNVSTVRVFPAMPVSLNVVFGSCFNFNLISNMVVYEKSDGRFAPALTIGAK